MSADRRSSPIERIGLPLLVFVAAFVVFGVSPVKTVTDSYWSVYTAVSLIEHRDATLDEYPVALERAGSFQVDDRDGHSYYSVPLSTPLMATPVVAVALAVDGDGLRSELARGDRPSIDPLIASLFCAGAVLVVFTFARRASGRSLVGLVVAGLFALGTATWSTASRALWMHGPSMLLVALAVLLMPVVADPRRGRGPAVGLGIVVATAFFVRPTNVVLGAAVLVWAVWAHRSRIVAIGVGAGSAAAVFLGVNWVAIGAPLPSYVRSGRLQFTDVVPEALLGNLVSPARGLVVFSPVLVLAAVGFVMRRRAGELTSVDVALAGVIVGQWLVISFFPHWWGGWSFGPRFWSDVLPVFAWFLVPVVARCLDPGARSANDTMLRVALALLGLVSVWINARGALDEATFDWNRTPVSVDADPGRVWDWSDLQFLR